MIFQSIPYFSRVPVIETLAGATVPSSLTYPVFSACSAAGSSPSIVCSGWGAHIVASSPITFSWGDYSVSRPYRPPGWSLVSVHLDFRSKRANPLPLLLPPLLLWLQGHFHQTSPTVRGPCLTHMRLSLMFGSQGGEEQSGTSSTNEVFVSERFGDLYTGAAKTKASRQRVLGALLGGSDISFDVNLL